MSRIDALLLANRVSWPICIEVWRHIWRVWMAIPSSVSTQSWKNPTYASCSLNSRRVEKKFSVLFHPGNNSLFRFQSFLVRLKMNRVVKSMNEYINYKSMNIMLNTLKSLLKHLIQLLNISWSVENNRRLYKIIREKVYFLKNKSK